MLSGLLFSSVFLIPVPQIYTVNTGKKTDFDYILLTASKLWKAMLTDTVITGPLRFIYNAEAGMCVTQGTVLDTLS